MNQSIKEDFLDILLYLFEYYSEDPVRESDSPFEIRDHLIGAGLRQWDDLVSRKDYLILLQGLQSSIQKDTEGYRESLLLCFGSSMDSS